MDQAFLPFDAPLQQYREQAAALREAWVAGDESAIQIVRHAHPRFLDPAIPWLPKKLSDADVRREAFSPTEVTVPWGPPGQVRFSHLSPGVEGCFDA